MKKLSSMIALGLALSMLMGMTAFAAGTSETTNDGFESGTKEVTISEVPETITNAVVNQAAEASKQKGVNAEGAVTPVAKFEIDLVAGQQNPGTVVVKDTATKITLTQEEKNNRWTLKALHLDDKGNVLHVCNVTLNSDGTISIDVSALGNNFSPFVIVKYQEKEDDDDEPEPAAETAAAPGTPVSPKTGETLPVAPIMAVICLAGAAVCAKKVRFNR